MSTEEICGWAAVAVAVYLLLLVVHPVHRCPGCRGRKVVRLGARFKSCGRCKGSGKAYRRGAVLMHRLLHEHVWPWLRDRINDAITARNGGDS